MDEILGELSGRIKLLLVDNEEGYAKILSRRLSKRNFDVCVTLGGGEGIRALRSQDFDAAIMDLVLEDMDGVEVLKVFKTMLPELPIIILTGQGSEQEVTEAIQFGACDYFTKPCEIEEVVQKIRDAIRKR
jgi:DNA-binding response OmpR family regulator